MEKNSPFVWCNSDDSCVEDSIHGMLLVFQRKVLNEKSHITVEYPVQEAAKAWIKEIDRLKRGLDCLIGVFPKLTLCSNRYRDLSCCRWAPTTVRFRFLKMVLGYLFKTEKRSGTLVFRFSTLLRCWRLSVSVVNFSKILEQSTIW